MEARGRSKWSPGAAHAATRSVKVTVAVDYKMPTAAAATAAIPAMPVPPALAS